jgi:hypothetical protein
VKEDAPQAQAEKPEEPVPRPASRRVWRIIVLTTVGAVIALYLASVLGYRANVDTYRDFAFTEKSPEAETSVIIRLRQFDTLQNSLSVDVLVHPGRDLLSKDPQSVNKLAIRLSSWTPSGELIYLHADVAPDSATTTLIAVGDPDNWPIDSYTTDIIGVEIFSGTGAQRQAVPAGIIVAGHINGWKIGNEPAPLRPRRHRPCVSHWSGPRQHSHSTSASSWCCSRCRRPHCSLRFRRWPAANRSCPR